MNRSWLGIVGLASPVKECLYLLCGKKGVEEQQQQAMHSEEMEDGNR